MLDRYVPFLLNRDGDLSQGKSLQSELLLADAPDFRVYYAPFDHMNLHASVVLVGITPRPQQAVNALNAARGALKAGMAVDEAACVAKNTGSFSGPMRRNLVDMLDHISLARKLGLESCANLFTTATERMHFTSMLRCPVSFRGADYSGYPSVLAHPLLRDQVRAFFAEELAQLPRSVVVPLGSKVLEVVNWLAGQGLIDFSRILDGMSHPLGANAERIAYFLGRKPKEQLSSKTNPATLEEGRSRLLRKIGPSLTMRPSWA